MIDNTSQTLCENYVPLQSPYPVIYHRGKVAMQTGTLLSTSYGRLHLTTRIEGLKTISKPVVSFVNKENKKFLPALSRPDMWTENVVWDVDVRNTGFVCFTGDTIESLDEFVGLARTDSLTHHYEFELTSFVRGLSNLGVDIKGFFAHSKKKGSVGLMLTKLTDPDETWLLGGNFNLEGLQIGVRIGEPEKMYDEICFQVNDYLRASESSSLEIEFSWIGYSGCDYPGLIEKLNKKYG
jgi:hypothetical protein